MGCFSVALLSLAVLASCNAKPAFHPTDKELVYHYHGTMTAGTPLPKLYNSAFVLDGKLHVQNDQNSTYLKFTDLKFKLSNGEYDEYEEFDGKMLPIPAELADLEKTFRVVHDPTGMVMGIATEPKELPYVVNIKKAMAAMFQLDIEKIPTELKEPMTFHKNENSVYGMGKVYYTVSPLDHMVMMIEKMQEPHSTQHMFTHMMSDIELDHCHAHFDEPITRDSQMYYHLDKMDNDLVVKYMEATSGIYDQPYEGQSNAFAIYVNHTMHLLTAEPTATKLTLTAEKFYHDLAYYVGDLHDITGPIPDHTNGRHQWDEEKLLKQAEEMMTEIAEYMEEDHINSKEPNAKRGQLMNRILRVLNYFDLEHFEKLHESLLQNTKFGKWYTEIYYEILPHIGTHASYYHIKKLVEGKKLEPEDSAEMLQGMFANVKFPNKKLVDDMWHMMSWGDDINKYVRKAAILSLGTLLHKANLRHKMYNHELKWYGHKHDMTNDYAADLDLNEDYPDEKYYQKYIDELMEKLKSATDDGTKILYMETLGNTRMSSVTKLLMPAVKGEMWENNHLRMIAALVISPMVMLDEDLTYELYWPMMTNNKLSTSLRIMSYYLIMKSQPSLNRLINIEWELQSTSNFELYQFHYRYLTSMAKTTDPCSQDFKVHINQVLAYLQPPAYHGLTGYYQMDYTDKKYGFGEVFKGYLIHDKQENEIMFKVAYQHHTQKLSMTPQWMFVRLSGMHHSFLKDIKLDLKSPTAMFKYEEFTKLLTNLPEAKDWRICITFAEYNQVVMTSHYDSTTMNELWEEFAFLQAKSFSISEKTMSMDLTSKTLTMPTEMGFPAVFQYYDPQVEYLHLDLVKEITNKIWSYQMDLTFKHWDHSRHGLTFYNPIADVWQGVNKYHSDDVEFNMLLDLQINPQQQSMKMSWKRHNEPGKSDMIGIKSHSMTMTFVKDDKDTGILQKSSPESKNFEIVSWGDQYRHDYLLHDQEMEGTGDHLIGKAFDSERFTSNATDNIDIDQLSKLVDLNHQTKVGKLFLLLSHAVALEELDPEPTMHGEMYKIVPLKDSPITSMELAMRFNSEYKKDENFMLPASKHNLRATWSVKNKDASIMTWDMNTIIDTTLNNEHSTMKVHVTRISPDGNDMKFCLDLDEKWEADRATLDATISTDFMGERTCTKADSVVNMTAIAERTTEQDEHKHIYSSCHKLVWSDIRKEQSLKCYQDHASLRKVTYMFNSELPETANAVQKVLDKFTAFFKSYYVNMEKPAETSDDMTLVMKFPMDAPVTDITIGDSKKVAVFEGIPMGGWQLGPPNTKFNRLFRFMHFLGLTNICLIKPDEVLNIHDEEIEVIMPKEWTMYYSNTEKDSKHGVWAKKIDDSHHIALRMVHKTHSLEIMPTEHGYDFFIDGKKLEGNSYHHSMAFAEIDWIKETNVISCFTSHFGSHILYDGHSIQIEYPQSDMEYFGHCFDEPEK